MFTNQHVSQERQACPAVRLARARLRQHRLSRAFSAFIADGRRPAPSSDEEPEEGPALSPEPASR
jgi:hypothetical protein